MRSDARENAVQRLDTALVEQERLSESYDAAIGTSSEFGAYVRLRGARDEVDARQAWLDQDDEASVRGRIWINGREVGGPGSLFLGLEDSHD
jgi:hypothetical protein